MQAVRVGVVGVGGMGSFHARTLATLAGVRVAAVSDPDELAARRLHDELGADVVDDPVALIADDTLDGVVIASPDDTHVELALAALESRRPLLLEKPLATSVAEGQRVIDAELAAGRRFVQLGFMREYDPAHLQVIAGVAEIGQIDHVRALHRNANVERRPLDEIVVQSMVHDAHTVHVVTGEKIVEVHASGSGAERGSFRHVLAICRLSSGAHAQLEFDDGGFAYEVAVEILGRRGDVVTGPPVRAVRRRDGSVTTHLGADWFGWFAEAYRAQDQAWVDSLRAGRAVGPSAWDADAAQRVVAGVMESLRSGRAVTVDHPARPAMYLR